MTCAVCQQTLCQHNDMEYSGLVPARHAGALSGRACGAGTSVPHSESASPKIPFKKTSFHSSPFSRRGVDVSV